MYGVSIGTTHPKSKKAIREAVADDPRRVVLYDTSAFDNKGRRAAADLPAGTYTFVGPDPYTKRNYFGNLIVRGNGTFKVE